LRRKKRSSKKERKRNSKAISRNNATSGDSNEDGGRGTGGGVQGQGRSDHESNREGVGGRGGDSGRKEGGPGRSGATPLLLFIVSVIVACLLLYVVRDRNLSTWEDILPNVKEKLRKYDNLEVTNKNIYRALESASIGRTDIYACRDGGKQAVSIHLTGPRTKEKESYLEDIISAGFKFYNIHKDVLSNKDRREKFLEKIKGSTDVFAVVLRKAEVLGNEISEMEPILDTCFSSSYPIIIIESQNSASRKRREAFWGRITQTIKFAG